MCTVLTKLTKTISVIDVQKLKLCRVETLTRIFIKFRIVPLSSVTLQVRALSLYSGQKNSRGFHTWRCYWLWSLVLPSLIARDLSIIRNRKLMMDPNHLCCQIDIIGIWTRCYSEAWITWIWSTVKLYVSGSYGGGNKKLLTRCPASVPWWLLQR